MSKRTVILVAALCLVIGGALGFAWHAPGHPSTWTDVRTWAGFGIVIIGAAIALTQMDLQRRQLQSQQRVFEGEVERNKRRDALLDGQLRELEQRAQALERQQANAIDLRAGSSPGNVPGTRIHKAEIANESSRPVRDVACRIEASPGEGLKEPVNAVVVDKSETPGARFLNDSEASYIDLLRAGLDAEFEFPLDLRDHPEARITARFTDDAGLHWQIDHDLHLEQLADRSDW